MGATSRNIVLLNSSGCTVYDGLQNVTLINTSGTTISSGDCVYIHSQEVTSGDVRSMKNVRYKKTYKALLTQTGTNAPTAVVLENTIGNIVWTRAGTGSYVGTLTGVFTVGSTYIDNQYQNDSANLIKKVPASIDTVSVKTYVIIGLVLTDAILNSSPITIEIF